MTVREVRQALQEKGEVGESFLGSGERPPELVKRVPQLKEDIEALSFLFSPGHPPKRLIRPADKAKAMYGFGDASGTRFGATFQVKGALMYSKGQWKSSWSEE